MTEDTSSIELSMNAQESEAPTRALNTYASYHRDVAADVDHDVLTPRHHAWACYFTDLATTVHDGQTRVNKEDFYRITETFDQYSGELPTDLRSVDRMVRRHIHNIGPRAHTRTVIQHQERSRAWNHLGSRNRPTR